MENSQPAFKVAFIDESQCVGCAKCLEACPVDAIVGSLQWMHTVITQECIGCQLCITPCPVDCISMRPLERSEGEIKDLKSKAKIRVQNRKQRLKTLEPEKPAIKALTTKTAQDLIAELRKKHEP
ncbi:MAG: RnfABCDGE type electron transport complex subunit B [Gammaproteobacteria bacterium]